MPDRARVRPIDNSAAGIVMKTRGPLTLLARSRKARWALGLLVGLPVLYVASFGPVCWMTASVAVKQPAPKWMVIYYPLGIHAARGPKPTREVLLWWMMLFAKKGTNVWVPIDRQPMFWGTPVPN